MRIQEAAQLVQNSPQLRADMQADPVAAMNQIAASRPIDTDPVIYRMIIGALGLTILVTVVGTIVLVAMGKNMDAGVLTLAGTCAGFMGGLLVPSPR